MKGISIKQKLFLCCIVPLLAQLALMVGATTSMSRLVMGMNDIYENGQVLKLKELKRIADLYAVNVIDATNKANVGGFSPEKAKTSILQAEHDMQVKWQHYRSMPMAQEERQEADKVQALFAAAKQRTAEVVQVLDRGPEDVRTHLSPLIMPLYNAVDPLSDALSALVDYQLVSAKVSMNELGQLKEQQFNLSLLLFIVGSIGVLFFGLWTMRSVNQPLSTMSRVLRGMQTEQDLSQLAPIVRQDEMGALAHSLNEVIHHFRHLLTQVNDMADQLAQESSRIAKSSLRGSQRVAQQQAETDQSATAMNQMSATIAEVANNSSVAADATKVASESARNGHRVVENAIEHMSRVYAQIQNTSSAIARLAEDSRNISSVMEAIRGIAEQTNLLALNAAIEAARAGEQGRGFAVVADEVRTLAQSTQHSTKEIGKTIITLQQGAHNAVESMEQGLALVEESNRTVQSCGQALEEIVSSVNVINEINDQIATAAEEQSRVAEDITRNVFNIAHIAMESAESSTQTHQVCQELEQLSRELKVKTGQFKC
ncbi:methyl-accepting chemotaxis protein [Aeromonas hydrophila]|uniref:methyl-accepting chemotaxis protein n=1 Tax=Aeromonas hydrophila TaxID=644 RepID=UPI0021692D4F|nr:methyl-accepting chemotaxis protein [Aeromonas hydrophila]MCS3770364.1 methyl-accepting chemotaxis protein [Aeromonas hydrophila]MCS3793701.1 methyl-accepting chemotaxis protein [Aeromonas hydrophila]